MNVPSPKHGDEGESLIEILIAIVIIGITATGLLTALSTSVVASDSHRRLSSGESVLRAYSELVKDKILHPHRTKTTTAVGPFAAGDSLAVPVADAAGFPSGQAFIASLDGVVFEVSSVSGTVLNGVVRGPGVIAKDAPVERYEPCPTPAYWDDVLTGAPELTTTDRIAPPEVLEVRFFDKKDAEVADCSSYHDPSDFTPPKPTPANEPTACWGTKTWLAACDPAWMRVTVRVHSTDAGGSKASLTTDIIVRRLP